MAHDVQCTAAQCQTPHEIPSCWNRPQAVEVMEVLRKVALVVLVVFAFYSEPEITGYFTAGGFVLGVSMHWRTKPPSNEVGKTGSCSVGLLSTLTGAKLPGPVELAAEVAIFWHHLEHCSDIFTALVGLNFGYKLGQLTGQYMPDFIARFSSCK